MPPREPALSSTPKRAVARYHRTLADRPLATDSLMDEKRNMSRSSNVRKGLLAAGCLLISCASHAGSAQTVSPTLEQTIDFINQAFTIQGSFSYVLTFPRATPPMSLHNSIKSQQWVVVGRCTVMLRTTHLLDLSNGNQAPYTSEDKIELTKLDPSKISLVDWASSASAIENSGRSDPPLYYVRFKQGTDTLGGKQVDHWVDAAFLDKALAFRVANAYINAIALCSGGNANEPLLQAQQRQNVPAPQQLEQQQASGQDEDDRQEKISQLRADIQSREQSAESSESSATQLLNNCSGPGAALCQALGQAGAARLRQKAAEARNQADSDREEIQRLEGQEVQASQRRDTSYGGSLQQVTTETGTNIQSAAAQQQANLQAIAASNQQRQQAQTQQQSAPSTSVPTARSSSVNTATKIPATTATSGPAASSSGNNPYSSAPAQGSYNPYTGTGAGAIQGSCTDMTGSVQGSVKIGSDGWVIGYLTNNSTETLYVSYTFKQNGVPSKDMANAGGTSIQGGQTVGGESQGLYSTGADKNQARIYWYAVRQTDKDKYGCVHSW
jgi:hypothetical protein